MKHATKILTLTPVALALLAGCAGSAAAVPPVSSPPVATQSVATGAHEVLTASQVTITNTNGLPLYTESFQVRGKASGPFVGSFIAKGSWQRGVDNVDFHETFTIITNSACSICLPFFVSGTIGGSIVFGARHAHGGEPAFMIRAYDRFGPAHFSYTIEHGTGGPALVDIIRRSKFSETLSDFTS
jgi:hypothetical protein